MYSEAAGWLGRETRKSPWTPKQNSALKNRWFILLHLFGMTDKTSHNQERCKRAYRKRSSPRPSTIRKSFSVEEKSGSPLWAQGTTGLGASFHSIWDQPPSENLPHWPPSLLHHSFPPWLTLPHPEAEPRPGQWRHCPCLFGALLKNTVLSSTHAFTYLVCVLATFPSNMCWPQGKYRILLHTCSFGIHCWLTWYLKALFKLATVRKSGTGASLIKIRKWDYARFSDLVTKRVVEDLCLQMQCVPST